MQEPLALIGIGCRFPSGADSPSEFWKMLCAGTDAIQEIPSNRWKIAAHYDPMPGRPGKSISKWGGFIDNIELFDASFFGISPREADGMDPQHRQLLEVTWEALEDAGQRMETLRGSPTGVFVGISTNDYGGLQHDSDGSNVKDVYSAIGCAASLAANRISYFLDLHGPSLAIDTACSSTLTACHVACQSLWCGDCQMAVVAGVNALLDPNTFVAFSRMSMLSPDGRCKAFDASANGFVRGEGVGAVVLKPLSAALSNGDKIYAVIRATATNEDGRTRGILVPSLRAQESLIRKACCAAGVLPSDISYVEAHGTGTPVGDPIETAALGSVLGEGRQTHCLIGSVKTNIGHLEAAAGIAGLIKVALILKHKRIPPSLHFNTPNPNIDFDRLRLRVVDGLEDFPDCSGAMLAAINSFGFGGANAHAILEAAPSLSSNLDARAKRPTPKRLVLPISAHSQDALRTAATKYCSLLAKNGVDASSICGAAATRRSGFVHRLCAFGSSREKLLARLNEFAAGTKGDAVIAGETITSVPPVFVFAGQGPQWPGMGLQLMREEPVFCAKIEECDKLIRLLGNWSLIEELSRNQRTSRLHETAIAQPAIFSLQVALAALWLSWGVRPKAVVGHSVGEVAAAHVAGVLTLKEAVRVVFHRGHSMAMASVTGRMLAAGLSADQAEEIANCYPGEVSVAAINSPDSVTLSGEAVPLEEIAQSLELRGIFNRFLQVNYAFHSHHMDPVKSELLAALGNVETYAAQLKLFSTVTGKLKDDDFDAEYWWRNVRERVRFSDVIAELCGQGHNLFLELSPHPALTTSISQTMSHQSVSGKVLFSMRRAQPQLPTMLANLCALQVAGAPIDWKMTYPGDFKDVALPKYPWQHERHWRETRLMQKVRLAAPQHPLLSKNLDTSQPTWNTSIDIGTLPWVKDHRMQDHVLFPGAGYVEMAFGVGTELLKLPLEVEDVEFQKALFVPEGEVSAQLQTSFSPRDATLVFSSRRNDDSCAWAVNATAKLRAPAWAAPATLDLERLRAGLPQRLTKQEVYFVCERQGAFYGPTFRAIEALWRSDEESLAKIKLPGAITEDIEQFQIHPVMLDACFQAMCFARPDSRDRRTLLPVRIDRITLYAKPGNTIYCHATLAQSCSQSFSWDLEICNESGQLLAKVEGCREQAMRRSDKRRADEPEEWLYETKWIEKPLSDFPLIEPSGAETWLVLSDRTGVAEQLIRTIKDHGGSPAVLYADKYSQLGKDGKYQLKDSFQTGIRAFLNSTREAGGPKLAGVVHLWSLDAEGPTELSSTSLSKAEVVGCHSLLRLVQELEQERGTTPIWVVTKEAQCVDAKDTVSVAQAPVIGIARTIMFEMKRLSCRLVDVSRGEADSLARHLWREMVGRDEEKEVAWRGNTRFASRIMRVNLESLERRSTLSGKIGHFLKIPASGVIDDLSFQELERRKPHANEVEIEVHAAALNFRDVLKLLGIYPVDNDRDLLLGDECSGRVVSVGKKVSGIKIGDHVIANGAGCFASHLTIPCEQVVLKPAGFSFEQAATIPVAFMTAWYALHELGRIKRGDRILIHAASGGVGLAAVQIAQLVGANIFATAGSNEKRDHLRNLGIKHIMDSRSTAFANQIRELTHGEGVDLVLNSLAGDAIAKGLSILSPGGRFLEIGKRDVYANTSIGLRPLRNNALMCVIDMGQVMADQPDTVKAVLHTLMRLIRKGKLRPLHHQTLPLSKAADAFRLMAQAKHIGKIVLSKQGDNIIPKPAASKTKLSFSAEGSYLITGGLSGFGLEMAKWLVAQGARNLVLVGRSGAATTEARTSVAKLRRLGAKVRIVRADVSDERQVRNLFKFVRSKIAPLRGIFHAAAVLDDGMISRLTPKRFSRVMDPKVAGAWNLHMASADLALDHFVMFSSIAALIGTPGQANYVAANCFLDALAHFRHKVGLPALSVNWGAISDVGILARNKKTSKQLVAMGVYGIPPAQATEMLGLLLQTNSAQVAFAHIDPQNTIRDSLDRSRSPRFSEILAREEPGELAQREHLRALIRAAPDGEMQGLTESFVKGIAARVLQISTDKLLANRPLSEMGLDSLMAVELLLRLEDEFEVTLPTSTISNSTTISNLAVVILCECGRAAKHVKPN